MSDKLSRTFSQEMDFDTEEFQEQVINVKYDGKQYWLRTASSAAVVQYRNAVMKAMKPRSDGTATIMEGLADVEPLLVSLCLKDDEDRPVALTTVKGWRSPVVKKLYDKAKDISDIDEGDQLQEQLIEALSKDDAPISLQELREWAVENLDKNDFGNLLTLLKPTPEEKAKNEQSDTTDG